jgi:outer membrane protein
MKKIILAGLMILLSSPFLAMAEETEEKNNVIGAGVVIASSPYEGDDANVYPFPIVKWRNERFFVEGIKGGVIVYENDDVRGDVFLSPRLMGYDADDSEYLNGMENREYSMDGGVRFKWFIPNFEKFALQASFATDLLGEHHGHEATAGFSKELKGDIYSATPSIGVKWQSENLADYYYGVRDIEGTATRRFYESGDAFNYYADLNFNLGLSEELVLVTYFGVEFLADDITDSPIVEDDVILTGVVGIAKRF